MRLQANSSAVFENSLISGITNPEINGSAIYTGRVDDPISAAVMLQGCELSNVTVPFFSTLGRDAGIFYSDTPGLVVYDSGKNDSGPARAIPASGLSGGTPFLTAEGRPPIPEVCPWLSVVLILCPMPQECLTATASGLISSDSPTFPLPERRPVPLQCSATPGHI